MTAQTNSLFFELLQISLGNRERLSCIPTIDEWSALLEETERQAITGVMFDGVEQLPVEQLPPKKPILLRWIGLVHMVEGNCLRQRERAAEMTRRFQIAGLNSCVLKGIATSLLYPHPLRRQCGDIDLLVNGKRKDITTYLQSTYKVNQIRWHHADVQIFNDVTTEIHFIPSWLYNPIYNKRLQKWFIANGFSFARETEYGFSVTSVEFEAVYSLMHSFHHLLECGIGFRHVIDYYYVLKKLPKKALEESRRAIKSIGLEKFCEAMTWVMKESCGMSSDYLLFKPNEKEGRFLLAEIQASGNFGHQRTDGNGSNTLSRIFVMLKHYPEHVIWMIPWKVWHWCWRRIHFFL